MADPVDFVTEPTTEEQRVHEWRIEQFIRLGFSNDNAVFLAESPDPEVVAFARTLIVEKGCTDLDLALHILS